MKIDSSRLITLDFEAFYSSSYSLTSPVYNTSAYVRDPQFHAHCCAIKVGTARSKCYTDKDIAKALKAIDWKTHSLLAHNVQFDGFILKEHYGIMPAFYYDTLSMARGLYSEISRARLDDVAQFLGIGAKIKGALADTKGKRTLDAATLKALMTYCSNDTDLCYKIFRKLADGYPAEELELIDLIIRMFCDSVLEVDMERITLAMRDEMYARSSEILKSGATEKELLSNQQFAALLKKHGVEPPLKYSVRTDSMTYALAQNDPEFLELLEHEDTRVVLLAKGRLAAKSTQMTTRASRMREAGSTGKLPAGYGYYAAKTGRLGGNNKLNLQNLPRVDPKNPKPSDGLRRSILAPKDHVIVVGDSAQIEARMNGWNAGDQELLTVFRNKEDPYCLMASDIYGRTITKKDELERFIGKISCLGLGYQMGAKKFQTTLALGAMGPAVDLPMEDCQRIVRIYRGKRIKIAQSWAEANSILVNMVHSGKGGVAFASRLEFDDMSIWLPNGMALHYPGLAPTEDGSGFKYLSHGVPKKAYGGLVIENVVQALARIVVTQQMLAMKHWINKLKLKKTEVVRVNTTTHDEIGVVVPTRYTKEAEAKLLEIMRTPPNWAPDLPVDAEVKSAHYYCK